MRTQISALYQTARYKYRLTLHGGENGLSNSASWVYLAEDIENVSFLKGGELIITTGLFTQGGITLHEFIQTFVLCNCSGILINVGKYLQISDLTPEIVEFCNQNRLPLFTMPWEIHLVDIMQEFCSLFVREAHQEDRISAAFQSALYQVPIQEGVLRTLNQFGFPIMAEYRIIAISNLGDSTHITSPLNAYGLKYHLFQHENIHILIYDSRQTALSLDELIEVICYCDSIVMGASNPAHTISDIASYYKRARFALGAAEFWNRPSVLFDQMGIFKILFCSSDPDLLQSMYQERLGALEQYDLEHDSEYLNTLRIYLLSDCNLLNTAARMHTHRNTAVYRIRKIRELLGSALDDAQSKYELLLAFYIREYLSI